MDYLILAINPGSTSTKIALYRNETEVFNEQLDHINGELDSYSSVLDELPYRTGLVLETLKKYDIDPADLSVIMGRGGMLPPLKPGGYRVNEKMINMLKSGELPEHASNLGAIIANDISKLSGAPAYIYDAVSANDFPPMARITGMKEVERDSFYHVLNSRAVAIRYAKSLGKKYEDLNLIVAHLGGGITVGAHQHGKIVESLADDNGPFGPERAGSVPLLEFIKVCYSGKFTEKQMLKRVRGMGGLRDLLGTSDGRKIVEMVKNGDEYATLVMEAQAYQIAKGIALVAPALKGQCDAILLTGGLARFEFVVKKAEEYSSWIAPVTVLPGEFEMEALALGGLRIMRGEEQSSEF